jgi:hypothetical protein
MENTSIKESHMIVIERLRSQKQSNRKKEYNP